MLRSILTYLISFVCVIFYALNAQTIYSDSTILHKDIDEIVITATRNERHLSNVTVPTLLVQAKSIGLSGNLRLNEILQEQTGLFLTSGTGSTSVGGGVFGNGIQIQGMAPDYTLIMLDGEPLIGRQGGIIDLSRFTLGNIQKIEVIKGPSSALYGSEAMGGVVNILTEQKRKKYFNGGIRYGSYDIADIFATLSLDFGKSTIYTFGNYNSSSGYDLAKSTPEKTMDPYHNFATQVKWTYRFSENTRLVWSNRFFRGTQESYFAIDDNVINVSGNGITTDININPILTHRFNDRIKTTLKLYSSIYKYNQELNHIISHELFYKDDFNHNYYRIENQTDWNWSKNNQIVTGGGYNLQTVLTSRYRTQKTQHLSYFFIQNEWKPTAKWIIIPGIRYDINSVYSNKVTPKISFQYKIRANQNINFSYGNGFKSPDFRQLYLYYINQAAQGYRVYGASEFSVEEMEKELQKGLIIKILPEAYQITSLRPEVSHGLNIGTTYKFEKNPLRIDVNLFYNNVKDLINYLPVAITNTNTLVFSYKNIKKAYTGGLEFNMTGTIKKYWDWSFGNQLLLTGDQEIVKKIFKNEVYGRNEPLGSARTMTIWEYSGLLGRSMNMINAKLNYENKLTGYGGSLRAIYRSRWGVIDLDGNGFANMKEEFAKGYLMINLSIQKTFNSNMTFQFCINNLLNHKDSTNVPQNPGIHVLGAFIWNFTENKE